MSKWAVTRGYDSGTFCAKPKSLALLKNCTKSISAQKVGSLLKKSLDGFSCLADNKTRILKLVRQGRQLRKSKLKKEEKETPRVELPPLSRKEHLVLEMLIESGRELYGLEMVEASRGALKRGTVYVTLQRMQEKGFVDSRPEPRAAPEIGIPRRLYSATRYGARVHRAYQAAYRVLQSGPVAIGG